MTTVVQGSRPCNRDADKQRGQPGETGTSFGGKISKCKHTKCPTGYIAWHEWAEKKSKTHKQVKCPNCSLWAIWVKK